MKKPPKYKPWFGLDGSDSFFSPWETDAEKYKAFIKQFKEEMRRNAYNGVWRRSDTWKMAEARRGLRAAKKGRLYRRRRWW